MGINSATSCFAVDRSGKLVFFTDLEFLVKCRDKNVIPKFLNFRLAARYLRFSLTYVHCQSNLLLEKIRLKKSNVRVLMEEFDNLRSSLQQYMNLIAPIAPSF